MEIFVISVQNTTFGKEKTEMVAVQGQIIDADGKGSDMFTDWTPKKDFPEDMIEERTQYSVQGMMTVRRTDKGSGYLKGKIAWHTAKKSDRQ